MLSLIAYHEGSLHSARSILTKALSTLEYQKSFQEQTEDQFQSLDYANNQMLINPIHMNIATFHYMDKKYFEVI